MFEQVWSNLKEQISTLALKLKLNTVDWCSLGLVEGAKKRAKENEERRDMEGEYRISKNTAVCTSLPDTFI